MTNKTHAWTPAMFAAFRVFCTDQTLTFRQICDQMNARFGTDLTRNACIGKAHRLRLPARVLSNNPAVRRTTAVKKPFVVTPILPILPPRSPQPFSLTLIELRTGDCKWPSGGSDPQSRPPFLFCGRAAVAGLPYCAQHTARAYAKPRPKLHP